MHRATVIRKQWHLGDMSYRFSHIWAKQYWGQHERHSWPSYQFQSSCGLKGGQELTGICLKKWHVIFNSIDLRWNEQKTLACFLWGKPFSDICWIEKGNYSQSNREHCFLDFLWLAMLLMFTFFLNGNFYWLVSLLTKSWCWYPEVWTVHVWGKNFFPCQNVDHRSMCIRSNLILFYSSLFLWLNG